MDYAISLNGMQQLCYVDEMLVDGGTFLGVCAGVCEVVAGGAGVAGGVIALGVPEPTGVTKVGGYAAIVAGGAGVIGGINTIAENL